MDAIVSGRAGIALLLDRDRLYSMHVDDPAQPVLRRPGDLLHLLRDAGDLRFIPDASIEAARDALEAASVEADALALFLVVLDDGCSAATRRKAARALEALLSGADPEVASAAAMRDAREQLLNLLHARPLPVQADVRGARAACGAVEAHNLAALLDDLQRAREAIRQVELAWEAIPAGGFGGLAEKRRWRGALIRSGAFRALAGGGMDEAALRLPAELDAEAGAEYGADPAAAIRAWLARLHEVRGVPWMPGATPSELLRRAAELERDGDWSAACGLYDQACRQAAAARDGEALRDALTCLGECLLRTGRLDHASDVLRLAVTATELRGDHGRAARALNATGTLLHLKGDVAGAQGAYVRAHLHARQAGDWRLFGAIELNVADLDRVRGDLDAARVHYVGALFHLGTAQDDAGYAMGLLGVGMVHAALGQTDGAEESSRQALELTGRISDPARRADIHLRQGELFLALGDVDRARGSCNDAYEIASRIGDDVRAAGALRLLGTCYREAGKLHLAEVHLNRAMDLAGGRMPPLEAGAQRELAMILRAQGRHREALERLTRSHALFTSLGAQADAADVGERILQLENDFLSLVRFWGESIEAKDRYTAGHCARVADYASRIAAVAGFTERELVWLRMGAFLHDVGKAEIPEEILNKPGRLTDEERAVMERHTVIGDEMLAPVDFPWDVRAMVRSHHERWDGRGYPDGLAATEIPLSARILRIAESFDALTTARSYRRPLSVAEALQIMEDDVGAFDPELFAIFSTLVAELDLSAERAEVGERIR